MRPSDMSGDVDSPRPPDLNTLTNNWAGRGRLVVLPPLQHKLHSVVEKLPVIPPISAVKVEQSSTTTARGRDRPLEDDNRAERNTRLRNNHLRKVYLVSLAQLLAVLLMVVVFTEVQTIRDYNNQHSWIGVLLIGNNTSQLYHILFPVLQSCC